ncbi:2-oxoglutarate dehydrogenase complex dihydrolipoyllysine-residue succinyltransferase [Thioalbus denitrificans]|uniref:Dihydrolipoyllysine-residue succinyltransferase n=1 Tax=Thioalbus denitrificans TaxID=547122 RepID=A0A369C7R3_9GAMM|nr:2-oxoglutarate dehydrogenase complex dihydrolipoyllysine-residue succinyltransferase [Thioalbus denitrificans]RCX29793.1 2-oxoglutarate dehydrogenase E2 component [Thioalbus denitrificans]
MSIEVKVPMLPESVADATVVTWHKQPGEAVRRDENLVDIETDKVVLEVPAPQDGVLREILKRDGAQVVAEEVLAILEAGVAAPAVESAPAPAADESAAAGTAAGEPETESAAATGVGPAVRRLLEEHGLDATAIPVSGDRLTKGDVLAYLENRQAEAAEATAPAPAAAEPPPPPAAPVPATEPLGARAERRVPMTRIRQRIAERLVEAQHTAAILTTFNEVDLKGVMDLRARYKDRFEKAHGVRLGFMSFFVKACVEALKRFPEVNASIDGTDIVYHGYYDVGIAVASPRGLVVPILRDVDQMSLADIENAIAAYGDKAKKGALSMEELTGGTFTLSNGGVFGSMLSTPILNPPQSAILGMHKTQERPVVVDGEIVIRPMMYLALSYDHRIIDGREAVQFLVTIKEALEDPARMLLQL